MYIPLLLKVRLSSAFEVLAECLTLVSEMKDFNGYGKSVDLVHVITT